MNQSLQNDQWADEPAQARIGAPVYSVAQIGWSSFFFGPLAGVWFMSRNFAVFGEEGVAFRAVLTGIVGTLFVFIGASFLPESFPNSVVPAVYVGLITALATSLQKQRVEELQAQGFRKATNWRVIGSGLVCLLVTLALVFGALLAIDNAFPGLLPEPTSSAATGAD